MKKAKLNYRFCRTEQEAMAMCGQLNSSRSAYMVKKYPAHYTPWESLNGSGDMHFVVLWHESF